MTFIVICTIKQNNYFLFLDPDFLLRNLNIKYKTIRRIKAFEKAIFIPIALNKELIIIKRKIKMTFSLVNILFVFIKKQSSPPVIAFATHTPFGI